VKLREITSILEAIAPLGDAAAWDNVGLLVGDPAQEITRVLLAIDLTRSVLDEAKGAHQLVVAYHPPIFDGLKRVVAGSVVFDAIRANVAIYSPHTALDVAPGGTNDVLADALGMTDRAPLRANDERDAEHKLVFFAPPGDVEKVSRAAFDAGAGRIGAYSSCSFRAPGTGTFFGEAGTNPVVGERGKLETVDELLVEMVVPTARIDDVVRALRAAHPYEEPAFDLVKLASAPRGVGLGRIGRVAKTSRAELVARAKKALGAERVHVAGPPDGDATSVAVCAGSGGDLVHEASRRGVDLYLTGELRHHDALRAAATGMTVVCALHSVSERATLPHLARRIAAAAPDVDVAVSAFDRDPFRIV
jgi:dinuclear metal center YbgI/SA1388 family protein